MPMTAVREPTDKQDRMAAALGVPVTDLMDTIRARKEQEGVSYKALAKKLREETGVKVTHGTLHVWLNPEPD